MTFGFSLGQAFSDESSDKVGNGETYGRCCQQFHLLFNQRSLGLLTSPRSAYISSNCSLIRHSVNNISNTRELKSICKATESVYNTSTETKLQGLMSF